MTPAMPFPFVFIGDGIADEDAAEWLRQVRLYGLGHTEDDKIRVFELCIAPGSPAWEWYDHLDSRTRNSFKAIVHEFKKEYAALFLPYLPLPSWLPLERLEQCVIREEDLGRDVLEERTGLVLPAHMAYARRIRRLSAAVYDQPEGPLVAEARRRLPPALRACISKQVKTWDGYVDALMEISTSEIEKAQHDIDPHERTWAANTMRHSPTQLSNMASYSQSKHGTYGQQSPTTDQPPAPHITFHPQNEPITNGIPSAIPVHVSSPTENAFPRSMMHSPHRTHAHGRGSPYSGGVEPYSRDTPSAPPIHPTGRSWLQTQRSPTGGNVVNGGNVW